MTTSRISIKFFFENPHFPREKVVPIFHRWIQEQSLSGHLLIDVASYEHIAEGPGVVLVSHEANIVIDNTDGRMGVLYQRKRIAPGPFARTLSACLSAVLECCSKLELDPEIGPQAKIKTDELVLKILDSLAAPNEPATLEKIRPELDQVLKQVFDGAVAIEQKIDPVRPFELHIKAKQKSNLMDLIDRNVVA